MNDETRGKDSASPSVKRIAVPERCTLFFSPDFPPPDSVPLSIPTVQLKPAGAVSAIFFLIMAGVAWPMTAKLARFDASTLTSFIGSLFDVFWLMAWMAGPIFFGALTLFFIFYRASARIQDGALFSILHFGPFSLRSEYDLHQIRELRIQPAGSERLGKAQLCFEYQGQTHHFGAAGLADELKAAAALIQAAIDRPGEHGKRRSEARGFDMKRFILKQFEKKMMRPLTSRGTEALSAGAVETDLTAAQLPKTESGRLSPFSSAVLLLVNLLPAAGVLFWNWDLSEVFALYWAENAVIGFYNILKIAVAAKWAAFFAGLFFIGHYGGFMAVHFLFVYSMFIRGPVPGAQSQPPGEVFVSVFGPLWMPLLAIAISHGISFFVNFLGRKEYEHQSVQSLMSQPYGRIIVLHLTIIFGGWMVLILNSPKPALLLLVGLKTFMDLRAHRAEHA